MPGFPEALRPECLQPSPVGRQNRTWEAPTTRRPKNDTSTTSQLRSTLPNMTQRRKALCLRPKAPAAMAIRRRPRAGIPGSTRRVAPLLLVAVSTRSRRSPSSRGERGKTSCFPRLPMYPGPRLPAVPDPLKRRTRSQSLGSSSVRAVSPVQELARKSWSKPGTSAAMATSSTGGAAPRLGNRV
jgi:hypothetical protein